MLIKIFQKYIIVLSIAFTSFAMTSHTKPPLLLYNQFPRVWSMDFASMTAYLYTIKSLGFNAVWVNPFMKTSKYNMVIRQNKATGETIKSVGSLYAMFDPSLIATEIYTETSTGNPSSPGEKWAEIQKYTTTAKSLGLAPIFDLVLNHISRDSPLVAGTFKHFLDFQLDTSEWFIQRTDKKWDDVVPFDYVKPGNIRQIFEYLWKPFIHKMIECYGFTGARIDFATGPKVNPEIIKLCISYIKELNPKAIIFAEDLYPGAKEDRIKYVLEKSNDLGFTHITNISMYLPEKSIGSKEAYEPILENLGLKKLMETDSSEYRPGTIGFPGSHDAGPTLFMAKIAGDSTENPVLLAKKRMAIAAFTSDAGWYLLAGDEVLSDTIKSPFIRQNGTDFVYPDITEKNLQKHQEDDPLFLYISSINKTFLCLRPALKTFWFEIFYSPDKNFIYFIRHLDKNSIDIVTVNIIGENNFPSNKHIFKYLKNCKAEIDAHKNIWYFNVY